MTALITREGLARLDAALAWIDEHPEQHDQDTWARRTPECGTTYCLAGVISMQAGATPVFHSDVTGRALLPDGREIGIGEHARDLLQAHPDAAADLFYKAGSREDLAWFRDRLAASLEPSP